MKTIQMDCQYIAMSKKSEGSPSKLGHKSIKIVNGSLNRLITAMDDVQKLHGNSRIQEDNYLSCSWNH